MNREPLEQQYSPHTIWRDWVGANAIGELVGLGTVAAAGYLLMPTISTLPATSGAVVTALAMTLLGLFEGAAVGLAQWIVLRRRFPGIARARWVGATMAGATIAWAIGMLPSTMMQGDPGAAPPEEPGTGMMLVLAAAMGALLGPVLALVQWRVLRSFTGDAIRWIPANALAWLCGMPAIFLGIDLAIAVDSTVPAIAILMLSLLIAGALVGAVHGWQLVRFGRHQVQPERSRLLSES